MSLRAAHRSADTLLVLVALLLCGSVLARAQGLSALAELSGSMAPALRPGDLVLDRAVPASAVRPGDVVSLREPATRLLITHRVVSAGREGDRVVLVTRGDANRGSERWVVPASSGVRRVEHRVPVAGRVLRTLRGSGARLALVLGGLFLLVTAAADERRRARTYELSRAAKALLRRRRA